MTYAFRHGHGNYIRRYGSERLSSPFFFEVILLFREKSFRVARGVLLRFQRKRFGDQAMENTENEPIEKLRGKTDKSLEGERNKTDDYLERKSDAIENRATETIRLNRLAADRDRENERIEVDLAKEEQKRVLNDRETSRLEEKVLSRERERADAAQEIERKTEDRVRATERLQKRLIAEALLEEERKETDLNLFGERAGIDLESEESSHLLSGEKTSHDLTKTALVTRDQFLAIVSHDLKNPLHAITMGADLMRQELSNRADDCAGLLNYIEIIERNATTMDRLISDLLDVERMANGKLILKLERTDLCALLRDCAKLSAPVVLSKSFSMDVQTSPDSIFADIDYDRILQVLSNLIGNALKFTPQGGFLRLSARKKDGEIIVSVQDNGPGISKEKQFEIFERFSQLRADDRRGLGLGLFISKWIVEAHEGRIWVDSDLGAGSAFSFTLPEAKD